jgi:hypothetical protein
MHGLSLANRTLASVLATGLFLWCAFLIRASALVHQFTVSLRVSLRVFPAFFTACHSASAFTQRKKNQKHRNHDPLLFCQRYYSPADPFCDVWDD